MTETEKELFVHNLKKFFRNSYTKDVAEKMCERLDIAKKRADAFENVCNLYQHCCQQFEQSYNSIVL